MSVAAPVAHLAPAGKYLSFALGREEYGLEILKVQEINSLMDITPVPRTPSYVRGVINLRGRLIPVINLRGRFQMPSVEEDEKTCIIVVQVQHDDRQVTVGLVVDEVSEVVKIGDGQIVPPPSCGGGMEEADFICGMGRLEGGDLILLDCDRLLDGQELEGILQKADGAT
jgi:purine-binding chemotaxis protein CheW